MQQRALCVAPAHSSGNLMVQYFQSNILTMLASFIWYFWETLLTFHHLNSLYRPISVAVVNVMLENYSSEREHF